MSLNSSVSIGGHALEYRRINGNDQKPTLVYLHEGLGCVGLWRDFPESVAALTGAPAFIYSRAGYGNSSPIDLPRPTFYLEPEGLETLPKILDAAQIGDCIIVGHSDGASIALIHAGSVRDPRVKGLVLMAPHVFTEAIGLAAIRDVRLQYLGGDLRARLEKYHGKNVDCAFWGWADSWLATDFRFWNIERFLSAIEIPILQIQGRDDDFGTFEHLKRIETQTPGSVETLILPDCQHSPYREQSEATRDAIVRFVNTQSSASNEGPQAAQSESA